MEENPIAEALRLKITEKLEATSIESAELDALIDEIGDVVININKIFISELRRVEGYLNDRIDTLAYNLDEMGEEMEQKQGGISNVINISLNPNDADGWIGR